MGEIVNFDGEIIPTSPVASNVLRPELRALALARQDELSGAPALLDSISYRQELNDRLQYLLSHVDAGASETNCVSELIKKSHR